jgi:hypothetical protein
VDPNKDRGQAEQFTAIVQFKSTPLTAEQLFEELKRQVDEPLDWQVVKLTDSEFSFQLPSRATFNLKIVLSLSKTEVSIRESFRGPTLGKALPFVWVQISRLPKDMMEVDQLMAAMVMVFIDI